MAERQSDTTETKVRLICTRCGYDVSGLPSGKCPECGGGNPEWSDPPERVPSLVRSLIGMSGLLGVIVFLTLVLMPTSSHSPSRDVHRAILWSVSWTSGGLCAVCIIAAAVQHRWRGWYMAPLIISMLVAFAAWVLSDMA